MSENAEIVAEMEAPEETGESDQAAVSDAAEDMALLWFDKIRQFVYEQTPTGVYDGDPDSGDGGKPVAASPAVVQARDLALMAAYGAIGAMCRRYDPPVEVPFTLDVSKMGRG